MLFLVLNLLLNLIGTEKGVLILGEVNHFLNCTIPHCEMVIIILWERNSPFLHQNPVGGLGDPFPKSEYFDLEMFLHVANFEKSNWFCLDGNALCLLKK